MLKDFNLLRELRKGAQQQEQTEIVERSGNITGFTTFYDTGSFTPTLTGSTTPGTFTYVAGTSLIEWTRIGNRLEFNGRVGISAIPVAPTGNIQISGFPFVAVANATMLIAGGGTLITWQLNVVAGYTDVSLQIATGATDMVLLKNGDNLAPATVTPAELLAVADFRFFGQYRVA